MIQGRCRGTIPAEPGRVDRGLAARAGTGVLRRRVLLLFATLHPVRGLGRRHGQLAKYLLVRLD